jgi:hypothetical protein
VTEPVRICGLGTRVLEETTLEALIALGECRRVFCSLEDPRALRWLRARGVKAEKPRTAAAVAAAARKEDGPVGVAVWGHPQFTSRFARELELLLKREGLDYRVYASVSPIGAAFARSVSFLGGDYGHQGMQCYDLESLLSQPPALTTRLPLIVFSEKSSAARWSDLFALLRGSYAPGHEARVYHWGSDEEIRTPVGKLAAKGFSGAVILVPPPSSAAKRRRGAA